jgi:adenylate cyclase, class 2
VITYAPVPTLEIEVKLKVRDPKAIPALLAGLGARLLYPREFEENVLYDFPDRPLVRRGAMLRVRTTGRGTLLTYKDRGRVEEGFKMREEVEAELGPAEGSPLVEILERLGMGVVFRYQKYRTTWEADATLVTLDETPIGDFLELEGTREGIDAIASRLGYGPRDYMAQSYRDLYLASVGKSMGPTDQMLFPDVKGRLP